MCVVCVSAVTVASLLTPTETPVVQNNVTEYSITKSACPKSKVNKIENNRICLKNGKVYRWAIKTNKQIETSSENKKEVIQKTETKNDILEDVKYTPCSIDPKLSMDWKPLESWMLSNNFCSGPYRILEKENYLQLPSLKNFDSGVDPSQCKIKQNPNKIHTLAFRENLTKHPSSNTKYQVVPIYSEDLGKPTSSPSEDYGKYFKFIENWTRYSSDYGSNVSVSIPKEYIKIDKSLNNFKIKHSMNHTEVKKTGQYIIDQVDGKINFSGVDFVIVIVPKFISHELIENTNFGGLRTNEGMVTASIFPPENFDMPRDFSKHQQMMHPAWWIHEMMHAGYSFDDNNRIDDDGMHKWGIMSDYSAGDLLVWHKWISGFIKDSQVTCFNSNGDFTTWVRPSTLKIKENKLSAIKLSSSKIIILESIRPYGLNFKMRNSGLLIYYVDTSIQKDHDGMRILFPQNRKTNDLDFKNSDAVFKLNDYIKTDKFEIKIIESGEFGDIAKIKINGL